MGTLGWGKPGELEPTLNTTPDPIALQGALAQLAERGFRALAMEVSSHGLEQGRVNGVRFKGALFTNVSRDHLDYHGTMEAYLGAKLKLLTMPGLEFAVCNLDDPSAAAVRHAAPAGLPIWGFSRRGNHNGNVLFARDVIQDEAGISFIARYAGESVEVRAPVFGEFNVENLLASVTVLVALGFPPSDAAQRMGQARAVPGRMERFGAGLDAPAVVVDYAHTPHALESVLRTLRPHCSGRLTVVFGCGGERDRGKRALMGAVAGELADDIVLTDDNPRGEDGAAIVAEILQGCSREERVTVIRDRREAIMTAIRRAGAGNVVLVAGKGHETTQEIQGVKHPFSDRQVVREALMRWGAVS
jgi:UDP-N-acetylmuramoyl-L-alanyl-D-glutamate--2,6-diaminopimelate ligase